MMLNFVCYLDGIKYSGSTVRAADPFLSLSRECKYEIYFQGSEELNLRPSLCKILISSFANKMDFAHNFFCRLRLIGT